MLKKLMIGTAASALIAGAAAAQSASPPAGARSSPPPAATQPAPGTKAPEAKSPDMTQRAPTATQGQAAQSQATFVNSQRPDQYLFSSFNGTDVVGADNQKIGDVSDVLFDKTGKIEAYVVGVGGFLGIGAKNVALAPSAFEVLPGDKSKNESDKLKLSMTKEQLQKAASFEPYKEPRTTGMGGGTAPARTNPPAGGGIAR